MQAYVVRLPSALSLLLWTVVGVRNCPPAVKTDANKEPLQVGADSRFMLGDGGDVANDSGFMRGRPGGGDVANLSLAQFRNVRGRLVLAGGDPSNRAREDLKNSQLHIKK